MKARHKLKFPVGFYVGLILLLAVAIPVAGASFFTDYDPLRQDAANRLQGISRTHLFGTDHFGRDVFARTLYGGRMTLISSITALLAAMSIGLFIGLIAGMFKGSIIDIILMRLIDALMAFPFMVLAMVIATLFGTGLFHLLVAGVLVWWVPFARLTRSIVLQARNDTYIDAAKVLGAPTSTIMFRDLLPRALGPVLIQATFELGTLILSISALSFFGFGSQPPAPEWGSMLSDGRAHFMQAPYILLGPALFITVTVLSLNMMGEGLRDYLDPYEILSL